MTDVGERGAEDGHLMETVMFGICDECGSVMFPVPTLAPCGHDTPISRVSLDAVGEVFSWTRAHVGEHQGLMVMADFLDGRLRVTAPLRGTDDVAIGDQVRVRTGGDAPYHLERSI